MHHGCASGGQVGGPGCSGTWVQALIDGNVSNIIITVAFPAGRLIIITVWLFAPGRIFNYYYYLLDPG